MNKRELINKIELLPDDIDICMELEQELQEDPLDFIKMSGNIGGPGHPVYCKFHNSKNLKVNIEIRSTLPVTSEFLLNI